MAASASEGSAATGRGWNHHETNREPAQVHNKCVDQWPDGVVLTAKIRDSIVDCVTSIETSTPLVC